MYVAYDASGYTSCRTDHTAVQWTSRRRREHWNESFTQHGKYCADSGLRDGVCVSTFQVIVFVLAHLTRINHLARKLFIRIDPYRRILKMCSVHTNACVHRIGSEWDGNDCRTSYYTTLNRILLTILACTWLIYSCSFPRIMSRCATTLFNYIHRAHNLKTKFLSGSFNLLIFHFNRILFFIHQHLVIQSNAFGWHNWQCA